jgi:diacylglycerol kinase (ATP)
MAAPNASRPKSNGGVMHAIRACRYSYDGLIATFRNEPAFRQLLAMGAVLVPVALLLPLSGVQRALLIGSVLLSLIIELFNSAIEAVVDRISAETHPLSKRAKDQGSAAQTLGLVNIAVVWTLVLTDRFWL